MSGRSRRVEPNEAFGIAGIADLPQVSLWD
jgi:hypothetical protein